MARVKVAKIFLPLRCRKCKAVTKSYILIEREIFRAKNQPDTYNDCDALPIGDVVTSQEISKVCIKCKKAALPTKREAHEFMHVLSSIDEIPTERKRSLVQ